MFIDMFPRALGICIVGDGNILVLSIVRGQRRWGFPQAAFERSIGREVIVPGPMAGQESSFEMMALIFKDRFEVGMVSALTTDEDFWSSDPGRRASEKPAGRALCR